MAAGIDIGAIDASAPTCVAAAAVGMFPITASGLRQVVDPAVVNVP